VTEETWSIAIADGGELHVWQHDQMPLAENLIRVRVRVRRDGEMLRFSRDDLPALRQLIGIEERIVEVARGPDAAAELERMLDRITSAMQQRVDELRGDDEPGPAP
jgi:hypothetical protein